MNTALILAILVTLFFLVMVGLSYKSWKWYQIAMAVLVFGSTLPVATYMAIALKTRTEWSKLGEGLEKQVVAKEKEAFALREGNPEVASPEPLTFLRGAQGEVFRILINRGRVWRGCSLANVNVQASTLKFTTVPPQPGDPGPPGLEVKNVVYLFKEVNVQSVFSEEPRYAPAVYVGEFQVTEVADLDVTISPTLPLDAQQASHLAPGGDVRWTIHEKMPTDNPEAFAGLDEPKLRALLPNVMQIEPARYEQLIQSYLRDGQEPAETDPPARRWMEVEFQAEHTETVDSATTQVDRDSRYFDDQGRALVPGLRSGGPVKFTKQQKAILPLARAEELINAGTCKKVRDVYRRELKDYAASFHEIAVRMTYLADRIGEVTRQTATLVDAQKKAQAQIDYRTQEKAKLEQDLAKFQAEGTAVKAYAEQLVTAVNATRGRANELFRTNLALAAELAALQKQLADDINKRTAQPTAAN
ncbi:MAG: hypothetical protein RLY70_3858 [Planctomycetota bacterium]|jgi:hypothetical protein